MAHTEKNKNRIWEISVLKSIIKKKTSPSGRSTSIASRACFFGWTFITSSFNSSQSRVDIINRLRPLRPINAYLVSLWNVSTNTCGGPAISSRQPDLKGSTIPSSVTVRLIIYLWSSIYNIVLCTASHLVVTAVEDSSWTSCRSSCLYVRPYYVRLS